MTLRFITTLITCTLFATMPLSAKEKMADEATKKALLDQPVINVKDLTEEMVMAFLEGEASAILEFSAGTLIPLKTSLEGNFISILPKDRDPIYFNIQQTFYLTFTEEDILLSKDLTNWSPASSFFSGDIDFSIETGPQGPFFRLNGELNH